MITLNKSLVEQGLIGDHSDVLLDVTVLVHVGVLEAHLLLADLLKSLTSQG
jgi:hypothetical protein